MQVAAVFNHQTSPLYANEGLLYKLLQDIFIGEDIHQNVKKDINIKYPSTGKCMEFDIWIPKHQLCFEFQDPYHYITTWYHHHSQDYMQQRDTIKKELAHNEGLTLINIPCWWDGKLDRLVSSITFERPDIGLIHNGACSPINLNPPKNFFRASIIPDVGELMLASFPHHKFVTENSKWWIGEKYDGIRLCWNANHQRIYSRFGKKLPLRKIFVDLLPRSLFIDGEFWFGRGQFQLTHALVNDPKYCWWHVLRLISFDIPSFNFQQNTYEERYEYLYLCITRDHPFNIVAPRTRCVGQKFIDMFTQNIIENGGEGVILQKAGVLYEQGRSSQLLKIKNARVDQEGIVVKVNETGVFLQLADGTQVYVGRDSESKSESELQETLKEGTIVTFSYESSPRQSGPLHPKLVRVRSDLLWDEVLFNYRNDLRKKTFSTSDSKAKQLRIGPKSDNAVNIKFESPESRRMFFENYAISKGQTAVNTEFWYSQSLEDILNLKDVTRVIGYHKCSIIDALKDLFPKIGLDVSKFTFHQNEWHTVEKRKQFFENYALDHKFNHLIADNWYSQKRETILNTKGAKVVVYYHNNSVARALYDLFPEIGIVRTKFPYHLGFWNSKENQRKCFEEYAKAHNFSPLDPRLWYSQTRKKLINFKGIRNILRIHGDNIARALVFAFPHIGLDSQLFLRTTKDKATQHQDTKEFSKNDFKCAHNRRVFFEEIARALGVDPHNPSHWYSVPRHAILSFSGIQPVVNYHEGSVSQALVDLFPDIGLDHSKFSYHPKAYWEDINNRRKFFENFAHKAGFDPHQYNCWAENKSEIMSVEGISKVVSYHQNSLVTALQDLFPEMKQDHPMKSSDFDEIENRRKFFENYAKMNGFPVLDVMEWRKQSKDQILAVKGANRVISHHGNSISKSLLDLFPQLRDAKSRLIFANPSFSWHLEESRREFFERYAKRNSFDPLLPTNWYSQSRASIMAFKGSQKVVAYHSRSLSKALVDLFPNIGLVKSQLKW